MGRGGK